MSANDPKRTSARDFCQIYCPAPVTSAMATATAYLIDDVVAAVDENRVATASSPMMRRTHHQDEERTSVLHQGLRQMRHADEGPARNIHGRQKSFPLPWARKRRNAPENRFDPSPSNSLEDLLQLPGSLEIQRQEDRSADLAGQRFDIASGLVIDVGDRELRAQRAESPSTVRR